MEIFNFNHLKESKMGYISHFLRGFRIGATMIFGGVCCIIHSVFPFAFFNTATNIIRDLYLKFVLRSN